jgi:hypothetical protein
MGLKKMMRNRKVRTDRESGHTNPDVEIQLQIKCDMDAILRYIYDLDGGVKNWLYPQYRYMETITSQLKLQITSFMGVRSRKYCATKPLDRLQSLTSLDLGNSDNPALRCNSRNNIHTDRGFVLQIHAPRWHCIFILK